MSYTNPKKVIKETTEKTVFNIKKRGHVFVEGIYENRESTLLENDPNVFLQGGGVSVEQIEVFLTERDEARASKNWAKSDRLRLELENLGVIIEDTVHGTIWRKG